MVLEECLARAAKNARYKHCVLLIDVDSQYVELYLNIIHARHRDHGHSTTLSLNELQSKGLSYSTMNHVMEKRERNLQRGSRLVN